MNIPQLTSSFHRVDATPIELDQDAKLKIINILRKLKLMSLTDLVCYGGVSVFQMRTLLLPDHQTFIYNFLLPFVHEDKTVEFYDKLSGYCTNRTITEEETTNLRKIRLAFSNWLKQFVNTSMALPIDSFNE